MKYSLVAIAGIAGFALAAPVTPDSPPNGYGKDFKFPLNNGFPNPGPAAITTIQKAAGGSLPNTPNPPNPGATGALDLSVIAANEIHEVAFFTELLHNITSKVAGYEVPTIYNYDYVVDVITAIKNQEELHALAANSLLKAYGQPEVTPCQYSYPVSTFTEAIALAATFTDVVLGALQSVVSDMAMITNPGLAEVIASIIGQEAEQDGWFRFAQSKVPSAAPFLTNTVGVFAYNAVNQMFIVPGTCSSNPNLAKVPILGALSVVDMPTTTKNQMISFAAKGAVDKSMSLVYMSGQNVPVVVPITMIASGSGESTFQAQFPYSNGAANSFARGLTVAALTKSKGPFANNTAVADDAVFGPGIIEDM